jgi:hypothetical protein
VITHGDRPETFSVYDSAAEAKEALVKLQVSLALRRARHQLNMHDDEWRARWRATNRARRRARAIQTRRHGAVLHMQRSLARPSTATCLLGTKLGQYLIGLRKAYAVCVPLSRR